LGPAHHIPDGGDVAYSVDFVDEFIGEFVVKIGVGGDQIGQGISKELPSTRLLPTLHQHPVELFGYLLLVAAATQPIAILFEDIPACTFKIIYIC
jgi:hypothetical protein